MKFHNGDLFTSTCRVLGHGVNCEGVMGAGIARMFRDKFPENYRKYRNACLSGVLVPGSYIYTFESPKLIVNLATQKKPGPDAKYDWLFSACYQAAEILSEGGYHSMAIPQIGCGIGGLEWHKVKKILELIEELVPGFEFEVWVL